MGVTNQVLDQDKLISTPQPTIQVSESSDEPRRVAFTIPPALSPEEISDRERAIEAREADRVNREKRDRWSAFIRDRGERYKDCTLGTFTIDNEPARRAVSLLREYCESITDRLTDGDGLILFGPKGTGKDHLMTAAVRAVIGTGRRVTWQNGMDLFGDVRDMLDSGTSERKFIDRLVGPDVLYLSDPLPPMGRLTEFQASMLFRVIDGRYSRRRVTWATINVSGRSELDERLGPQNADRLVDGALALFCNWPSFRKPKPWITTS